MAFQPYRERENRERKTRDHLVLTCTGCKAVLVLPIPSTVVTAMPSTAHNGSKQPFAAKCLTSVKVEILAVLLVLNRAGLLSVKPDKKREYVHF